MNCPVCSTSVENDATMCPHCQSDLEIFQLIVKANEQRQTGRKLVSALGVFAAVTAIGWASVGIFSSSSSTPKTSEVQELCPDLQLQGEVRTPKDAELIALLQGENASLKTENASLSAKLTAKANKEVKEVKEVKEARDVKAAKKETKVAEKVTASDEKGTTIHTVREGDTFWIISRKYFGTGTKFKQIAKDNGMTEKTRLHKGMKIKIVKS